MITWWQSLELAQQIFALVGIASTVVLVVQIIMLLFGMGNDSDGVDDFNDPDGETGDGLTLFTVKGILSMLCITGWTGVIFLGTSMPTAVAYLLSFVCGFAMLVIMGYAMKMISKLQSSGNIDIGNAVGKVGQVYLPIKPNGAAAGKVNITIQGKYSEFSAITTADQILATGSYVRVVAVDEAGTLVVEPISNPNSK